MNKKRPFFKGIPGFTRETDELLARDAYGGIYYWWWRFLRINPVFWYARTYNKKIQITDIAKTHELLGDLSTNDFYDWWRKTGKDLFSEAKRPRKVRLLDLEKLYEDGFTPNSLYIEIPLTIRKETILKQFKHQLNNFHKGRELNLANTSTAKMRLYTKKYRLRTIEIEYWTLLYRSIHRDIEVWRIGDRLQISPSKRLRIAERGTDSLLFDRMNSLTGRYIYKAKFTLKNIEHGVFPNVKKSLALDNKPFGPEEQESFLNLTGSRNSEFHIWLKKEFDKELNEKIIQVNRLQNSMKMPDSIVRKKFPDFVSGKTDLLD